MSVVITIRGVPDDVRDELAARAARAGKSLQEYVHGMFVEAAARPPVEDIIARARARVAATGAGSTQQPFWLRVMPIVDDARCGL